jgi:hypothetical protein
MAEEEEEQCDWREEEKFNEMRRNRARDQENAIKKKANAVIPSRHIVIIYMELKSILKNQDVARNIALLLYKLALEKKARICMEGELRMHHGLQPDQSLDGYNAEDLSQAALQELVATIRREHSEAHNRELHEVECYIPRYDPPRQWEEILKEAEVESLGDDEYKKEERKETQNCNLW